MDCSYEWNEGESPSLIEDGKVIRCKSENHMPTVAVQRTSYTYDHSKGSCDRLQIPGAISAGAGPETVNNPMSFTQKIQARYRATDCVSQVSSHPETGGARFQYGFNLSKTASLVNPTTHTMSWWNNL